MSGIENLSSLEAIRVNGCGKIGPEAVRRMLTLPNLRVASLHGVSGFPTDAEELVPSDSLENVHFSFSDENACKAGSEWAKKYPLLVFGGFSG